MGGPLPSQCVMITCCFALLYLIKLSFGHHSVELATVKRKKIDKEQGGNCALLPRTDMPHPKAFFASGSTTFKLPHGALTLAEMLELAWSLVINMLIPLNNFADDWPYKNIKLGGDKQEVWSIDIQLMFDNKLETENIIKTECLNLNVPRFRLWQNEQHNY